MKPGLFEASAACLALSDPQEKCSAVSALSEAVESGEFHWDTAVPVVAVTDPGRPRKPRLVDPSAVPRRRLGNPEGRAALVHAVAHIEFNAINLALDAICRFRDMPQQYFLDWISVAQDEARHFSMMQARLEQLGRGYGDFPAHNGLWEMAAKTADNCLLRMALVPRVLEARGLDVTPGMIKRLAAVGDSETVAMLEVILAEEVRHVRIGTFWFRFCCQRAGQPPSQTFLELIRDRFGGSIRGPLNREARIEAGFSEREMEALINGSW